MAAQAKGLTKQLWVKSTNGAALSDDNMFALLADESADKQLDGVERSGVPAIGKVTLTARDEQHRQSVLR